jgi:hypothetical protein
MKYRCYCDSVATEQYARVAPDELDTARVRPQSEDILHNGTDVREAHLPRHSDE